MDASLEATINPNYQETTYEFEYATNEALAGATILAGGNIPAGPENQPTVPADIGGGLEPGTTYFYRVLATNGAGTTDGPVEQFTTQANPTSTIAAPQEISRTTAVLLGAVNPGGATTSYYFAYIDQTGYEAAVAEGAANPYAKAATRRRQRGRRPHRACGRSTSPEELVPARVPLRARAYKLGGYDHRTGGDVHY